MSLGINNDQGLNIREESRFVWLDTFNYIQDSQVISQDSICFQTVIQDLLCSCIQTWIEFQ